MADTRDQPKPGAPPHHLGAAAPGQPTQLPAEPTQQPKPDALLKKLGEILAQATAADRPGQATSEGIEGGRFIRGARLQNGKQVGGQIVDAQGEVLATFEDDQVNTGNPDDGKKPEKKPEPAKA